MSLSIRALCVGRAYGLPKPSFTYMRNWGDTQQLTLIMYVIEGGQHPIVVDTGADPTRSEALHQITVEQEEFEKPENALERAGIDPDDVRMVVNTHLHWDHSSNNHLFRYAEIVVQQKELDFARNPVAWHRPQFEVAPGVEPAWRRAEAQIRAIEGDTDLAPGVTAVALPGHTPGSQGVLVDGETARYLIAGDTVYLYENWIGGRDCQHIPVGLFTDLEAYESSLNKIHRLNCEVIPSHDSLVLEREPFR